MYCNELKLRGVLEEFFYQFTIFGFKNAKNQIFEENKRFEYSFYQLQVQVIANQPSRLEKHQALDILLMTDFFMNF